MRAAPEAVKSKKREGGELNQLSAFLFFCLRLQRTIAVRSKFTVTRRARQRLS